MGLFGNKKVCDICNEKEGSKNFADGCICKECLLKSYRFIPTLSLKKCTKSQILKAMEANERNNERKQIFQPTKKIEKYISFDSNNELWDVNDMFFTYDEIISYELLEDGISVTKGGLGQAIAGGVLFGGIGAVVGGMTGSKSTKSKINEYRIRIITRNDMCPEVYINLLEGGSIKSGGILYKSYKGTAQKILMEFAVITDSLSRKEAQNTNSAGSEADEIMKFKKLCDDGIITLEEFEAKKKQILGL